MKIWYTYGSEHSANLVIIGTFKSGEDAQHALHILNGATEICRDDENDGLLKAGFPPPNKITERMLKFMSDNNFPVFNNYDAVQLLFDYDPKLEGDKLIITTEEYDIEAFIKILLDCGAKVETYSAHSYPSPYGRQTYEGD
jgi:hypothetical protein